VNPNTTGTAKRPLRTLILVIGVAAGLLIVVSVLRRARPVDREAAGRQSHADGPPAPAPGGPSDSGAVPTPSQAPPPAPPPGAGSRQELSELLRFWGAAVFEETRADEGRVRRLVELLNTLGKDALYESLQRSAEPRERWAAFSALCSWMSVGDRPLQSLGSYAWIETRDERFTRTAEELALGSASEPRLRRLAIQALGALPSERAAAAIAALLAQSGAEADVFDLVDSYTRSLPEGVRSQAVRRAAEVLGNPSSDEGARAGAIRLLRNRPDAIVALVDALPAMASVPVRRVVAAEAARLMAENSDLPAAASVAERLFALALTSDDPGVQINIVSFLGDGKVRDRYGAAALRVLVTLAERDANEGARIASIRMLGQGGYTGARETLNALAKSPSEAIAGEAQSALRKLGP
jgi:hypothetical protein